MPPSSPPNHLRYQRSRFSARLPLDRLYVPAHFWIQTESQGVYRVGFTRFAKRMLGEIVECGFDAAADSPVALGQIVGWVEAFKAVSDLYCVGEGRFLGGNPLVAKDPGLIDRDTEGEGWLYRFSGRLDPQAMDAHGYAAVLDAHIDRMLGEDPNAGADGEEAECT